MAVQTSTLQGIANTHNTILIFTFGKPSYNWLEAQGQDKKEAILLENGSTIPYLKTNQTGL